jgi:integration host factor subunit alpha
MTKSELTNAICDSTGMLKLDAFAALETLLEIIKDALEDGEEVKVSGFGKWEVKPKHERQGRNPQTGESIRIAGRRVVTFRPSALLKDRLNG